MKFKKRKITTALFGPNPKFPDKVTALCKLGLGYFPFNDQFALIHVNTGKILGTKEFIPTETAAICAIEQLCTLPVCWQWLEFEDISHSGGMSVDELRRIAKGIKNAVS